jgi:hypothetical protein
MPYSFISGNTQIGFSVQCSIQNQRKGFSLMGNKKASAKSACPPITEKDDLCTLKPFCVNFKKTVTRYTVTVQMAVGLQPMPSPLTPLLPKHETTEHLPKEFDTET